MEIKVINICGQKEEFNEHKISVAIRKSPEREYG